MGLSAGYTFWIALRRIFTWMGIAI